MGWTITTRMGSPCPWPEAAGVAEEPQPEVPAEKEPEPSADGEESSVFPLAVIEPIPGDEGEDPADPLL